MHCSFISCHLHPSPSISIHLHPSPCISIYLHLSLSISIYLHLSLSISIYLHLSLSISIHLHLSPSISIHLHLSSAISIHLHPYRCARTLSHYASCIAGGSNSTHITGTDVLQSLGVTQSIWLYVGVLFLFLATFCTATYLALRFLRGLKPPQ